LNELARQHSAIAIIHSGDFGFYEPESISSISDRTLKHLVQYSSLIPSQLRSQLLNPSTTSPNQLRQQLTNDGGFLLSEFPKLLSRELKFNVPVYTVWGACEDVQVLEKIRLAPPSSIITDPTTLDTTTIPSSSSSSSTPSNYSIPNLTVLDEATTRVLNIGGIKLRLFGLGGAVVPHKLFDNGQGSATIAGGFGTMWTTMLQIGELIDTAQKVYDPSETRLLITHSSPGREGLMSQLGLVLKVDLTVSAGLHFRYGVSYNEFSVCWDPTCFESKLQQSKKSFNEVWDAVKNQVESVVDENQKLLLNNALLVVNRVPSTTPHQGGPASEETAWKNCWNWNLPDAAFGSLVLDIENGRIGSEMKSLGFNFAYRTQSATTPISVPTRAPTGPTSPPPPPPPPQTSTSSSSTAGNGRPQSTTGGGGFNNQHRGFPPQQHRRGTASGGYQQQQSNIPNETLTTTKTNGGEETLVVSDNKSSNAAEITSSTVPPPPPPTGPRQQQQQQRLAPPRSTPKEETLATDSTSPASSNTKPSTSTSQEPNSSITNTTTQREGQQQEEGGGGGGIVSPPPPNATAHERTPGSTHRGRGRGGRGGGAPGSRGRSNGEWRGRGGGGRGGSSRQVSTPGGSVGVGGAGGDNTTGVGAGTPNTNGGN